MAWIATERVNEHGTMLQQCLSKWAYSSRKHARRACKRIEREHGQAMTTYRCALCRRWHLTKSSSAAR